MKIREAAKNGLYGALKIAGAAALAMSEAAAYDYYDVIFEVKSKGFYNEKAVMKVIKTDGDSRYYSQVVRAIHNAKENWLFGGYDVMDVIDTIETLNKVSK